MSSFLYRMLQRAAGTPAAAPTPQPPRQFHWPAVVGSPVLRPNALRPLSMLPPSEYGGEPSPSFREERMGESALSEGNHTPGGPTNVGTEFRTTRVMAAEINLSQATAPPKVATADNGAAVSHQHQTTPTQVTNAVTDQGPPEPSAQMMTNSQPPRAETFPRVATSPHRQSPASLHPSTTQPSSESDSDSTPESLSTVIERTLAAINGDTNETVPHPPLTIVPTRTDSPRSRQTLSPVAPPRSASLPLPSPVEVKIGSVEIVFDPAPAPSQPAQVRPVGFSEFADLRRYATRPWPSTRR